MVMDLCLEAFFLLVWLVALRSWPENCGVEHAHRQKLCHLPHPAMGRGSIEHREGWGGSICQ